MITLFYAAVLGVVMAVLSIRVPMRRFASRVSWGDGGDPELATRIRVFGNFTEYVPMLLLLMLLIERAGGAPAALHVTGMLLVALRLLHAVSLHAESTARWRRPVRFVSAFGTWLILAAAAAYALVLSIPAIAG